MGGGAPRRALVAAVAGAAALILAARDGAELLRERARRELAHPDRIERARHAATLAAALWPDRIADADLRVRWLAADGRRDPARALAAAEAAAAAAPRRGAVHLRVAMLASEARSRETAAIELARAGRSDPFHGELQAAVARELLVDAVLARDEGALRCAAHAFASAVRVGALPCDEAYAALAAAGAPSDLFRLVAGPDPVRLERLVEHHARALEREGALAAADALDSVRQDPACAGRALAHRRLGAALLAAGRAEAAAQELLAAAALSADPDALALTLADALLQCGANDAGAAALSRALESGHADAERAAGSIRCAREPDPARLALFEVGRASGAAVRRHVAAVLAELGDRTRCQELLAAPSPGGGP